MDRTRKKNPAHCPCCMNRVVVKGINDLATTRPELAKEWHPTKNRDLTPYMVTAGSSKRVWWKCSVCGKDWNTVITSRRDALEATLTEKEWSYLILKVCGPSNIGKFFYEKRMKEHHPEYNVRKRVNDNHT